MRIGPLIPVNTRKTSTHMHRENGIPREILSRTQQNRVVVQDFRPLAESLEWKLGQHDYQRRGNRGFVADAEPIPFLVNNDGNLSASASDLLFTSLIASERQGPIEDKIFVLEVGIGVGLFARLFLDRFRDRCDQDGKDYYDRLCYVAADRSEKILVDACRHGTFANHPGGYVLRLLDAGRPLNGLRDDSTFREAAGAPFRAVFLNYVLDCLPAADLHVEGDEVRELYVRTYLARGVELAEYTDLTVTEILRLANADDTAAHKELAPLYGLFASEYDYRRFDPGSVPFGGLAVAAADGKSPHFRHNYGAVVFLTRVVHHLTDGGFILVNDYGTNKLEELGAGEGPQRFSSTSAVGLNFILMAECLKASGISEWVAPSEDDEHLFSRLLVNNGAPSLINRFREQFGKRPSVLRSKRVAEAREYRQQGRHELALGAYERALRDQPWNWALASEVARFLAFTLSDPIAGLALNRAALSLNPCCSAALWNELGECLVALNRIDQARRAFQRALQINPNDPRAHGGVAVCHVAEKDDEAALRSICEGLISDRASSHAVTLLRLQRDALQRLHNRRLHEGRIRIDRVSRSADQQNLSKNSASAELSSQEE
jgi:hypothetical protein